MTLIEFLVIFFTLSGLLAGAVVGIFLHGLPGGFVGAIAGVLGAWLLMFLVSLPLLVIDLLNFYRHRASLAKIFGPFYKRSMKPKWFKTQRELTAGQQVKGKIVLLSEHELVLDIGCGFPGSLWRWLMTEPQEKQDVKIGDEITATIKYFQHRNRYVILTQQYKEDKS